MTHAIFEGHLVGSVLLAVLSLADWRRGYARLRGKQLLLHDLLFLVVLVLALRLPGGEHDR